MKQVLLKVAVIGAFTALALCHPPASPLLAQEGEMSQLRQKVVQLESRVRQLEALLEEYKGAMERSFDEERAVQINKNWGSLEAGMSEEQVRSILGEPVKVIKGVKTLWYYPNIYDRYVSFDDKGRVVFIKPLLRPRVQ